MSLHPFVVIAEFDVPPDQYGPFLDLCRFDAEHSVADEDGCHAFDVLTPEDEANVVVLHEVYADRAAFETHLKTPHFDRFATGVKTLGVVEKSVRFLARRTSGA
ncbi:hypothetical protein AA103196_1305 [Ameyamaea chiangmaiensis NBRC 103196]|uniref:Antibiotic biosynthesis monooxygenase n=1 Tax=Ameyamaea chiangmaiensis TaxID=442969 RepID=A0A850P7W2_9PROT|nr:putative quinol monooxygenase [Ameyamaea chiangmaiensis]MBS4075125.1 antibiotic biosynthesis monooxygenase [Ameyamaea chiangmaiensis]NVN40687.1 antibiotic biosynthesis monooxygenase [Ameyamaea chiangmaiensis]GBQ66149.1 hypothetical protein AA103196_1305 [Ameyamaea chiangmaiensis NBRC 103196]